MISRRPRFPTRRPRLQPLPPPIPPYPRPAPQPPPGGWPRISIVVPSFNQGRFLEQTLASILSQNYPNLECIVVDGGSSDESVEIIRSCGPRIAWWCSEKDGGHADALNKGFAKSTGEIMCWLNSDDLMAPWGLWVIGDVFARFPQVEWLTGSAAIWDSHGRLVIAYPGGGVATDYLRRADWHIQQESTFWRRSLWMRAGGRMDTSYRLMIDLELWLRFFRCARLHSLETIVAGYRWHGANRAQTHPELLQAEKWRAILQHLAPLCRRTRLLVKLGLAKDSPGNGFWPKAKSGFSRKIRRLFWRNSKPPIIRWDPHAHQWRLRDKGA